MTDDKEILVLYSGHCLTCPKLVDDRLGVDLKAPDKACCYTDGNERCPAKTLTITKGLDMIKAATSYHEAEKAGKKAKMEYVKKRLSKFHPAVIDFVRNLAAQL